MRKDLIAACIATITLAMPAFALPPLQSQRPELRPTAGLTVVTASSQGTPLAVSRSLRPMLRIAPGTAVPEPQAVVFQADFTAWRAAFRNRALAQGIRPETFDRAFAGVVVNPRVINRDSNQAEFSRTLWEYLDGAVSDVRVSNGRAAMARHADTLARIERRYGVEAEVVLAVWGLESAYGAMRGNSDIITAMATLAHEGRRRDFFEAELIAAMRILQAGDVAPRQMTGSWAGAMGHTQFMPTSYLAHAVDFNGDGRRDIWSDDPTDALASTANYLRHHGWTTGQPWGVEVVLPQGFDYGLTGEGTKRGAGFWRRQGVRLADGGQVPDHGQASILLPAGHRGVALMIFDNFHVIERYNPADAYVIGIGHLADRIAGAGPFRGAWPRDERGLSRAEREELQRRLVARGLHSGAVDGIIGPQTADSVRRFQASVGMVPDGFASLRLLERLR
ncbi:lytic murein transglycosylase [Roseicyclus sp.]|uniref:lytic murein transglycosylase n=1 Tax=Roseicyclus sp. TaxID=1914329 RepID=UPI003F6B6526